MLLSNNHDCLVFFFENSFYCGKIQAYTSVVRIYYDSLTPTNLHHPALESSAEANVALPFSFSIPIMLFWPVFLFADFEHLLENRAFCVTMGLCWILFYFLCLCILIYCVCVHLVKREYTILLELDLQVVVSHLLWILGN